MNLAKRLALVSTVVVLVLTFQFTALAAGELDTSFNSSLYAVADATVHVVEKQPDGKILVGGYFSAANTTATAGLIRLNLDGTVDPSLSYQNLFNSLGGSASVTALALQTDGKIIVAGLLLSAAGTPEPGVRRLNSDGSLDTTFTPLVVANDPGRFLHDIEIQPDGKILVGGVFVTPGSRQNVVRLNVDGSIDSSFASQPGIAIRDMEVLIDGSVMVVGHPANTPGFGIIRRLTSVGVIDTSFPAPSVNDNIDTVKIRANGQILVGGKFTNINGFTLGKIALFNADGSLDLTFNQNMPGASGSFAPTIHDIEIDAEGRIMIGGRFALYNGVARTCIARLNSDGSLDTSFAENTRYAPPDSTMVVDLDILSTGQVIVGSQLNSQGITLTMFTAAGVVDPTFNAVLSNTGLARRVVHLPDGKIVIGGTFTFVNGVRRMHIARLNPDGSLDESFVPYSNTTPGTQGITALAVQPDGKIVIGMAPSDQTIRLNTDGSRDLQFNSAFAGAPSDIVVLPNGQILTSSGQLRRLNSNGTTDTSFSADVSGVRKIHLLPDGKILVAGTFSSVGTTLRGRIARLNSDGSLDATFNPPGGANGTIENLDVQTDGRIVVGGDFTSLNGAIRFRLGRFHPDGSLDTSFAPSASSTIRTIKIQPDGKILIGGSMSFVQSELRIGLARLNSDGSLDSLFNGRPNGAVYDVALQADNKILIGGAFLLVNNVSSLRVARLLNSSVQIRTPFDYDGDGRADISVFRASENKWYVLRSSDSQVDQPIFGLAGDIPVPADYDGDGKTDAAIFRPSNGQWWYLSSVDGAQFAHQFGETGDIPRPSDFDGDGKDDLVLFRPSNSTWYRFGSMAGHVPNVTFGLPGDQPVIGDFDGDARSDLAIFRPSNGDWWYAASSAGGEFRTVHWGQNGDLPVPADYDGDGKTDYAVYRPSEGGWYIYNSGNGSFTTLAFGTLGDRPVAADYDGDGRADIAVFRPSSGVWYLLRSTSGFAGVQFGISTDTPTPSAFVQ
jgi:uncharacterized delta-60 repeat protein